jgi:hypothetical protein
MKHFSPQTAAFARRLRDESGHQVCCVVDEENGAVDVLDFLKISLTRRACREIGLFCPFDMGWRCGDYGFYFARQRFPDERFFWLIESDVRFAGPHLGLFFECFRGADNVDLIAGHYRAAERWWYWTHTMTARNLPVWRCLFPVVRLSAPAVDLLHEYRRLYARRALCLANWPNDESFVATVLTRAGLRGADLNSFGTLLYDEHSYTFSEPFDGDTLDERARPLKVMHPILFGDDLRNKRTSMALINKGESVPRKVKRRVINALNSRMSW